MRYSSEFLRRWLYLSSNRKDFRLEFYDFDEDGFPRYEYIDDINVNMCAYKIYHLEGDWVLDYESGMPCVESISASSQPQPHPLLLPEIWIDRNDKKFVFHQIRKFNQHFLPFLSPFSDKYFDRYPKKIKKEIRFYFFLLLGYPYEIIEKILKFIYPDFLELMKKNVFDLSLDQLTYESQELLGYDGESYFVDYNLKYMRDDMKKYLLPIYIYSQKRGIDGLQIIRFIKKKELDARYERFKNVERVKIEYDDESE